MFLVLFVVFIVMPLVELYVIVQVAQSIDVLPTIGLLLLVSVVGAWLVRREGVGIWRRAQQQMAAGKPPGKELVDGLLVLLAGALMLTPGFVTDAFGLLLLFPPTRLLIRSAGMRYFKGRVRVIETGAEFFRDQPRRRPPGGAVFEADEVNRRPPDAPPPGELD